MNMINLNKKYLDFVKSNFSPGTDCDKNGEPNNKCQMYPLTRLFKTGVNFQDGHKNGLVDNLQTVLVKQ